MSAIYPLSVHRRIERQWAERIARQIHCQIVVGSEKTLRQVFKDGSWLIPGAVSWTGDVLISLNHVIDFPNHSRSYDQTRRAVRFWGHDSAIEASFFIDEDALTRIQPDVRPDEPGFLSAFDCAIRTASI